MRMGIFIDEQGGKCAYGTTLAADVFCHFVGNLESVILTAYQL